MKPIFAAALFFLILAFLSVLTLLSRARARATDGDDEL